MTAPFMVIRRRQLRTAYPVTGHINRLPQVTVEIDGHVPAPPRLRLLAGWPQQRRHEAAHHDALHQQQVRRSREHEAPRAVRVHRQLDGAQHLGRALHLVEDDLATFLPQCGGERGRLAADHGIVEGEMVPGADRGALLYERGLAGLARSRDHDNRERLQQILEAPAYPALMERRCKL